MACSWHSRPWTPKILCTSRDRPWPPDLKARPASVRPERPREPAPYAVVRTEQKDPPVFGGHDCRRPMRCSERKGPAPTGAQRGQTVALPEGHDLLNLQEER